MIKMHVYNLILTMSSRAHSKNYLIIMNIELNTEKIRSVNITSEIKFEFQSTIEFKLEGI